MKKNIKNIFKIRGTQNSYVQILLFLLFIFFIKESAYCQKHGKTITTNVSPRYTQKECRFFKDSIVVRGDRYAYGSIGFIQGKDYPLFSDGELNEYELVLPYALILANRYNDSAACYDIYRLTIDLYKHYNIEMDENTRLFLLHYLEKGAELGNIWCREALESFSNNNDNN